MIRKTVLFSFYIVVFNLWSQEYTYIKNDSVIIWKENIKLQWVDFQGDVDEGLYGLAKTIYKIDIIPENVLVDENDNIQGYEDLTVKAIFYKNFSWTSAPKNDLELLKHEQLHFDIAELFARKIRRKFKELQKNKEARFSVYWKNYNVIWKECRAFQKQFDTETNHGRLLNLNYNWSIRVKDELSQLKSSSE